MVSRLTTWYGTQNASENARCTGQNRGWRRNTPLHRETLPSRSPRRRTRQTKCHYMRRTAPRNRAPTRTRTPRGPTLVTCAVKSCRRSRIRRLICTRSARSRGRKEPRLAWNIPPANRRPAITTNPLEDVAVALTCSSLSKEGLLHGLFRSFAERRTQKNNVHHGEQQTQSYYRRGR